MAKNIKTINEEYDAYIKKVYAGRLNETQLTEMKKSFMAGFTIALCHLTNLPEDEDAAMIQLDKYWKELNRTIGNTNWNLSQKIKTNTTRH